MTDSIDSIDSIDDIEFYKIIFWNTSKTKTLNIIGSFFQWVINMKVKYRTMLIKS